jgi:hypothetical protein
MKFIFDWPTRTISGTRDKTTFMSFWDYICIGRRWVMPIETPQNITFAAIAANLKTIWKDANPLYKNDFKTYAHKHWKEHLSPYQFPPRTYALFIDMMYAWYDTDPTHIDLSTVTIEDIISAVAPSRAVNKAVDDNLLKPVSGYEGLDNLIQV